MKLSFSTGVANIKHYTMASVEPAGVEIKLTRTAKGDWGSGAYGSRPLKVVRFEAHRGTWDVDVEASA